MACSTAVPGSQGTSIGSVQLSLGWGRAPPLHIFILIPGIHIPAPILWAPRCPGWAISKGEGLQRLYSHLSLQSGLLPQCQCLSPEWESLPGRCIQASLKHTQACRGLLSFFSFLFYFIFFSSKQNLFIYLFRPHCKACGILVSD